MNLKNSAVWYVYELIDPRDNCVFYVGKGKGNRIEAHEKDAANPKTVCSKKINKIKEIWSEGCQVERKFNAFFWDEQSAYDHETDLIDEIGLHNLTNILPGGQKAWVERKAIRAARKEKPFNIHSLLDSKDEKLFVMFRNWFFMGLDSGEKELKVSIEGHKNAPLYAQITEAAYNKMLPMLLECIKKSETAIDKFAQRMKPYNVNVVYGSA